MSLTTAKEILSSIEFNRSNGEKRHPPREFQAYAYRLAYDLNDLENLKIYLRLAKNLDRSLLESAYSYVSDIKGQDKSRIFLWKLKKLREELQEKKDKFNFEQNFVLKKQKLFRNKFYKEIMDKSDIVFDDNYKYNLQNLCKKFGEFTETSLNLLLIGFPSKQFLLFLCSMNIKLVYLDISTNICREIKSFLRSLNFLKGYNVVARDFLKKEFKDKSFDIVIDCNWNSVPFSVEKKYLLKMEKILDKNGKIVFVINKSKKDQEEWKYIYLKGLKFIYYFKSQSKKKILENFSFYFKIENIIEDLSKIWIVVSHKN